MPHVEQVDASVKALQEQLNAFWSTRREITGATPLNIRTERELQVWMEILGALLPPASADVVDVAPDVDFWRWSSPHSGTGHAASTSPTACWRKRVKTRPA